MTLAAATAMAQSNNIPQVQHVIVIVQENRTPTNLFQQDSTLINNGAHIVSQSAAPDVCAGTAITLQPAPLYTCWDPLHSHASWTSMWHNGRMNGACNIKMDCGNGPCPGNCTDGNLCYDYQTSGFEYCSYTYVENTIWNNSAPYDRILQPYFQIAETYGFANYMFQTNQGPSFPAHQFLLSGTSAPVSYDQNDGCLAYTTPCYEWFASENDVAPNNTWGCPATSDNIWQIDTNGLEYQYQNGNGIYNNGIPCYNHNTLAFLLDNATPNKVTWKYYARTAGDLWTAPNSISAICDPVVNGACTGSDWKNNVAPVLPNQGTYDSAPILDDIENCKLQQVSWVIPDGNWSDHADNGKSYGDGGPPWVAAIVNAIGNSKSNICGIDYWGYQTPQGETAEPTVILVTWDDWGGYYDDVIPPDCPGPGQCSGYFGNGNTGNGQQYVYGFRVPLLVVSAYAKQSYISGTNVGSNPNCTTQPSYCHDFGSVLDFIEYAFGSGGSPLGAPYGIAQNQYWPYADYFVMDTYPPSYPYSLWDFFSFGASPNSFSTILGAKYGEECFHNPKQQGCFQGTYPMDPDNDANE